MAEPDSILDTVDEEVEAAAVAEAEAEIDAGKGVPHERVRTWLHQLSNGDVQHPPC